MQPIRPNHANVAFGAPANWDAEKQGGECQTLYAFQDTSGIYSYWKPSAEELKILAQGGVVQLGIVSQTQPPVSLEVVPIEDEPAPVEDRVDPNTLVGGAAAEIPKQEPSYAA